MKKFLVLFLSTLCLSSSFGASYSYWLNGWRKNKDKVAAFEDILVVETNAYLLGLDTADLTSAYLAPNKKGFVYGTYGVDFKDILDIKKTPLEISITVDKQKYVAKSSRAGKMKSPRPLQDVLLWESGRHFHRYEFKDVEFVNAKGDILPLYADLTLAAWEDSFALTLDAKKGDIYTDSYVEGVLGTGRSIVDEKITISKDAFELGAEFSAAIWVNVPDKFMQASNNRGPIFIYGKNHAADGAWGIAVDDIYVVNAFARADTSFESSGTIIKKGWNLFVLSYGDKTLKFYANGNLVGKNVVLGRDLSMKDFDITLGSRGDKVGDVYSMLIDEFKVWNKVLSPSEVKTLYKDAKADIAVENIVYKDSFDGGKLKENNYSVLKNLKLDMQLGRYKVSKTLNSGLPEDSFESLTLAIPEKDYKKAKVKVAREGVDCPVVFDEEKQCFSAVIERYKRAKSLDREFGYEDYSLSVKGAEVPFLLHIKSPADITGLCPILCHKDGTPTGIQVQLSKNWHERSLGAYLMAYAKIPEGDYILRVVYGFYGKHPSASHANLSLIGYGGSGRWEQLAIGSWGETICFDADNSLVTNMITDIRMLMSRDGKDGRMWSWTEAGWGGDWLNIKTSSQERLMPVGLKTSYIVQGPCLTDVVYEGYLGEDREISMKAKVQTLRTNDYARTFQRLEYKFNKDVNVDSISVYGLKNLSKQIVMGNKDGLIGEYNIEGSEIKTFDFGKAGFPYWFSAIGRDQSVKKSVGYKALAIRDFGFKSGITTSKDIKLSYDGKKKTADLLLPNTGLKRFKKGDTIYLDIELFTLHAYADDYYGDNEIYRQHLEENPMSYKTTEREALGNNLKLNVKGGDVLRNYPIEIAAKDAVVEIEIDGGVGLVPLRISNLPNAKFELYEVLADGKLEKLDQSVFGNDFFQVEYNEYSKTYSLTYNLPLCQKKTKWVLRLKR